MFTDIEVLAAMRDIVEKKGPDHRGEARYEAIGGGGECFLGVLSECMTGKVPLAGCPARYALGVRRVSGRMEKTLTLLQELNDNGYEWKYLLIAAEKCMDVLESSTLNQVWCPCGCDTGMRQVHEYIDMVRARDQVKRAEGALNRLTKIAKKTASQVVESTEALGVNYLQGESVFSYSGEPLITPGGINVSVFTLHQLAAEKKDHALVA